MSVPTQARPMSQISGYSRLEPSAPRRSLGLLAHPPWMSNPEDTLECFALIQSFLHLVAPPSHANAPSPDFHPHSPGFLSCSLKCLSSLGFVKNLLSLQISFTTTASFTISVQITCLPRADTCLSATRQHSPPAFTPRNQPHARSSFNQ